MKNVQQQPQTSCYFVRNHRGAKEFADHVQRFLSNEMRHDVILGPFKENPFNSNICLSPLNTVPVELYLISVILEEPRSIISFPEILGQKINLSYPGVDSLVSLVKRKGRGCLLFKGNLSRAYRQIILDPGEGSLLGYAFNGSIYLDNILSFGLRRAAYIMQVFFKQY